MKPLTNPSEQTGAGNGKKDASLVGSGKVIATPEIEQMAIDAIQNDLPTHRVTRVHPSLLSEETWTPTNPEDTTPTQSRDTNTTYTTHNIHKIYTRHTAITITTTKKKKSHK